MSDSALGRSVGVLVAVAGVIVLGFWLVQAADVELHERVPGRDMPQGPVAAGAGSLLPAEGLFETFEGVAGEVGGAWPRFRGANFDNISTEKVPLARRWGEAGPPELWAVDLGEGYAGPVVLNGRVYLLDYDAERKGDALRCFSLEDGKEIWRYSYPVKVKRFHGMSRTVPAVTDKYVLTLGPKCHVLAADAATGRRKWMIDLVAEYGATIPPWYAGQCPLIDDGRAIIAVGGPDVLMMAVDMETGRPVWKTPNTTGWRMTHSSVMPMAFANTRMYVYCAGGGVLGVSADDGRLLWRSDEWKINIATVPSPVIVGDGRIFLSGGYNAGAMMLQLRQDAGSFAARVLWRLDAKTFGAPQQTPILYKGHIYGVRPDRQLVCLDLNGRVVWTSETNRFGKVGGPYMIADGMILVMDDEGTLTLVEATPEGYRQLARARVLYGHESWGPMALAGGRLLVRDLTRMVCLDLAAGAAGSGPAQRP